jgi:hypothetical protein
MEKVKRGAKRDDGFIYWGGTEAWVTPARFDALRIYFREYRARNREAIRKCQAASEARIRANMTEEERKAYRARENARNAANREKQRENGRKSREKYRDRYNERARLLKFENPEKHAARLKRRRDNKSHLARLAEASRARMNAALGRKKHHRSCFYLGCSWVDLARHLENQFAEGMSWDNHCMDGWHVDHIVPVSSARTMDELIPLLHFTNLQPLWGIENMKKGNKLIDNQ